MEAQSLPGSRGQRRRPRQQWPGGRGEVVDAARSRLSATGTAVLVGERNFERITAPGESRSAPESDRIRRIRRSQSTQGDDVLASARSTSEGRPSSRMLSPFVGARTYEPKAINQFPRAGSTNGKTCHPAMVWMRTIHFPDDLSTSADSRHRVIYLTRDARFAGEKLAPAVVFVRSPSSLGPSTVGKGCAPCLSAAGISSASPPLRPWLWPCRPLRITGP